MREIGIDISGHRSKPVDEFMGQKFDYVITVCDKANEQCPIFPGHTQRIHWSFEALRQSKGSVKKRAGPSGESGYFKWITCQVANKNHNAINYQLPIYDTLTNDSNNCFLPTQGEGTAPGARTGVGGR